MSTGGYGHEPRWDPGTRERIWRLSSKRTSWSLGSSSSPYCMALSTCDSTSVMLRSLCTLSGMKLIMPYSSICGPSKKKDEKERERVQVRRTVVACRALSVTRLARAWLSASNREDVEALRSASSSEVSALRYLHSEPARLRAHVSRTRAHGPRGRAWPDR